MVKKPIYDPVSTPEEIRERSRAMLDAIVQDTKTSTFLEKASWNHAVEFCKKIETSLVWDNFSFRNAYTQKILSVRYNLRQRPDLMEKMKKGEHSIKAFVFAKPHEICPEKWEEAFEIAARKALRFSDASAIDAKDLPDGMLECRKCKSKKTSYFELQTRSADEPKQYGWKSITPGTSGPCARGIRLDFQIPLFVVYVSC
jgi:DNA-directed RNA polymerase subunit M/transcription elongation factor TFIIS